MEANQTQKWLMFVVDGSSAMAPHWLTIFYDHVSKIIRHSCNKWRQPEAKCAKVELGLVMYNVESDDSEWLIKGSEWTTNEYEFLGKLSTISFNGRHTQDDESFMTQGLSEALVMFPKPGFGKGCSREYFGGERHCVVVGSTEPSAMRMAVHVPKIRDGLLYGSHTDSHFSNYTQVAHLCAPLGVSLSVISPFQFPAWTELLRLANNGEAEGAYIPTDSNGNNGNINILISQRYRDAFDALFPQQTREQIRCWTAPDCNERERESVGPMCEPHNPVRPTLSLCLSPLRSGAAQHQIQSQQTSMESSSHRQNSDPPILTNSPHQDFLIRFFPDDDETNYLIWNIMQNGSTDNQQNTFALNTPAEAAQTVMHEELNQQHAIIDHHEKTQIISASSNSTNQNSNSSEDPSLIHQKINEGSTSHLNIATKQISLEAAATVELQGGGMSIPEDWQVDTPNEDDIEELIDSFSPTSLLSLDPKLYQDIMIDFNDDDAEYPDWLLTPSDQLDTYAAQFFSEAATPALELQNKNNGNGREIEGCSSPSNEFDDEIYALLNSHGGTPSSFSTPQDLANNDDQAQVRVEEPQECSREVHVNNNNINDNGNDDEAQVQVEEPQECSREVHVNNNNINDDNSNDDEAQVQVEEARECSREVDVNNNNINDNGTDDEAQVEVEETRECSREVDVNNNNINDNGTDDEAQVQVEEARECSREVDVNNNNINDNDTDDEAQVQIEKVRECSREVDVNNNNNNNMGMNEEDNINGSTAGGTCAEGTLISTFFSEEELLELGGSSKSSPIRGESSSKRRRREPLGPRQLVHPVDRNEARKKRRRALREKQLAAVTSSSVPFPVWLTRGPVMECPHASPTSLQQQEQPNLVNTWEGAISTKDKDGENLILLARAKAYRKTTSSSSLTASWPQWLQISCVISQSAIDSSIFERLVDEMVFEILRKNKDNKLFQILSTNNLCAKVDLSGQTLILAPTTDPNRFNGTLIQGEFHFRVSGPTQEHLNQQSQ